MTLTPVRTLDKLDMTVLTKAGTVARSFAAVASGSFRETLEELGLAEGSAELGTPEELGRRAALAAAAEAAWKGQLGPLLETDQVRRLVGVKSRQAVSDLGSRRRLLALPRSGRRVVYPAFQFAANGRPFEVLPRVLAEFEERGAAVSRWTIASWFVTPQPLLGGQTPAGWLKAGRDPEKAVLAARRTAARMAG